MLASVIGSIILPSRSRARRETAIAHLTVAQSSSPSARGDRDETTQPLCEACHRKGWKAGAQQGVVPSNDAA
jgi:hypothetical protein